jgi:PAT family beta-lactamase induction signal transducer AmpG
MSKLTKLFVMFSLGFASGLPYMIIISTSTAWLRDADIELAYIGFFSWVTFMYAFKFLWAPLVDRFSYSYIEEIWS